MSSEDTPESSRAPMTHEERLALAARLDRELDEFIEGLERKRYTDGWPEDRWEEEMDKHPFFMKTAPADGQLSPLAEGLAKLKYDPAENTPLELATSYKEDGNFNFKHKNYRLAIIAYTEGIKVRCEDADLQSSLYNNRAAANYHLNNFRTALFDSERALSLNPDHAKALERAAKAAFKTLDYDKCIKYCELYLTKEQKDEIKKLLKDAKMAKVAAERDARKKEREGNKKEEYRAEITKAILERGIKILKHDEDDDLDITLLEPTLPGAMEAMVHFNNGVLTWPVLILYPEYGTTDFIRGCPENVPLSSQLEQLFPAPWDEDNKYSVGSINVYFEGSDKKGHKIDPGRNLSELLTQEYFVLKAGTPAFVVVVRGSSVERKFLDN